jgi:hypothetical protein
MVGLVIGLWPVVALGAGTQKAFDVADGGETWDFDVRWKDHAGAVQEVSFAVPRGSVDADRTERTWFPRREFNEYVVRQVRAYNRSLKGKVEVTAKVQDGGVAIGVSGPADKAKAIMAKAEKIRDDAIATWIAENDFFVREGGELSFDHAALVAEYTDDLAPVAAALKEGTDSRRAYVEKALSFVQAIPYEAQKQNGGDPGYRRPLALLYRNRGDCDSKAVLFLGLVEAAYPELDEAVIYVPGHALTGVSLPAADGDRTFEAGGKEFVYAEPVGPAPHPLGTPDDKNKNAGKKGEVRVVPAG